VQNLTAAELSTIVITIVLLLGAVLYYLRSRRISPASIEEVEQPRPEKPTEIVKPVQKSLQSALLPTRDAFWGKLKGLFQTSSPQIDEVEELLYTSDLGPKTVQKLLESVETKLSRKEFSSPEALREALVREMKSIVNPVHEAYEGKDILNLDGPRPIVWLVVGVNGAGKTTTIGKLAGWANAKGMKVLVAAGDTFRAAAASQLSVWSQRAQVEIFEGQGKPSGVAFDAVQKGISEKFDVVIVDTAGRLHTQSNLMEELKKVKRVIEKALPGAPRETLLVLDANNGQNALVQARQFHEALGVNGVILTKLDGTAKGGVVIGLAYELGLPIRAIGIGERMEDIRPFSAKEFVESII